MKILVIGSGGREHALAWKLRQSPRVTQLFCAPGNAGTEQVARNVAIPISDHAALLNFALSEKIELTVVGPDDALAAGIVDLFQENGLRIFGPTRSAARFESSKIFAKEFMQRHGIPTAASGHFSQSADAHAFCQKMRYPLVIKADGLALGKGVIIASNAEVAAKTIYRVMDREDFGAAGRSVVIEEFLTGPECSIHALVDGKNYLLFPSSQDHKRAFDGDTGPNTGGMGAFSSANILAPKLEEEVRRSVLEPFLRGLEEEGISYRGMLYPGLMLTPEGLRVLEFNCRFGDPETQALLPRLKTDLLDLLEATIDGALDRVAPPIWDERSAVCVAMVSQNYPEKSPTGRPVSGLHHEEKDTVIFHAGTKRAGDQVVTNGGRVLGVTSLGATVSAARNAAYASVRQISFEGARWRGDIALQEGRS